MSKDHDEPTQTTDEGYEIPVPRKGDVFEALRKSALVDERHETTIVERGGSARWKCSCGAGGGGRWKGSADEAQKAADRHQKKSSSSSPS